MNNADELLDLVDDDDIVIGQVWRSALTQPPHLWGGNVRAAELFIMNDNGELWVPRRSARKEQWPGGYDMSAAEHVGAGETYEEAIIRGVSEELNIAVRPDDIEFLGMVQPDAAQNLLMFRAVYKLQRNEPPQFNRADFMDYEWLTPAELHKRLLDGATAKNTVLGTLELFM